MRTREPARDLSEGPPRRSSIRRRSAFRRAPPHARSAPRRSGAARQHQRDLVHVARAGAGGAPSADVLDRIARALMLTDVEREHLFLLGLGRPPEVRYQTADGVTPRLQRVLDALDPSPAVIRTATWDVVAWNRAAAAVLTDYRALPPEQRNILRLIFFDPRVRAAQYDWEAVARFVVGAFRADAARAGAAAEVEPWWTNSAGSVPSSRRCGATTTSAATAAASNICGIRSPDRSLSNIRPSRSTAGPISAWWSTIRRLRQTPSGSDRSSSCRPGKLLA